MNKYPQRWEMRAGATWRWQATWYQGRDTDGEPADPVDLTGYYARCQGRASDTSTTELWDVDSNELGGITLGDEAGTIVIEIEGDVTESLAGLRGVWGIERCLLSTRAVNAASGRAGAGPSGSA